MNNTQTSSNTKLPFNTYVDHNGYVIPKSPIVKNTPEIIEWLKQNTSGYSDMPGTGNLYKQEDAWVEIGISTSKSGFVYKYCATVKDENFQKFHKNSPYVKVFDDNFEAFKKYMLWVKRVSNRKFTCQFKHKVMK